MVYTHDNSTVPTGVLEVCFYILGLKVNLQLYNNI